MTNPLRTWRVGASNCDGTVLDFLSSRSTQFKYHTGRTKPDFTEAYKALFDIAIDCPNKDALKKLRSIVENAENVLTRASEGLAEAELCMNTLQKVLVGCSASIDEQITEATRKKEAA